MESAPMQAPLQTPQNDVDDVKKWVYEEREWWQTHYQNETVSHTPYQGSPDKPQGIRHFYREMLLRYIRSTVEG
jgi:hypothetical protein